MALRVALCCLVLLLSLLFGFSSSEQLEDEMLCQYIVRVKTGDVPDAGTDATISLNLNNPSGQGIAIDNLEDWGIMPAGHQYFQRDNLDFFRGKKPCINVCAITVTSDDKGKDKGWYLEYVEISITGLRNKPTTSSFSVDQWLSLDKAPYSLQADADICPRFSNSRATLSYV